MMIQPVCPSVRAEVAEVPCPVAPLGPAAEAAVEVEVDGEGQRVGDAGHRQVAGAGRGHLPLKERGTNRGN